ncbi:transposase [Saccharopolyspora pogona]|uniref:transposase n=1 Tax=Saccharopolyspora pogona TaxID=333966 RepID=UPI001687476A|nr:transposase [Saccharopolyspora pogona]
MKVTQYDQHAVRCGCGRVHTAARPEGVRPGAVGYGPNLQAFAVYLMVVHFIPVHRRVELLASLTGAVPSVGFVHGVLTRAAGVLTEVDKRIRTLAYAVCCDETLLRVGPPGSRQSRVSACQEQFYGPVEIAGVMSAGGGDVGVAGESEQADGGVAEAGHHLGCVAGADLAAVFVVGYVADPVQPVVG